MEFDLFSEPDAMKATVADTKKRMSEMPCRPSLSKSCSVLPANRNRKLLPWWPAFLNRAAQPNTDEQKQLQQIIADSLTYLSEYYAVRGSQDAATALMQQFLLRA